MKRRLCSFAALLVVAAMVLTACQTAAPATPTPGAEPAACTSMTPVKLQLQWVTQSQFAGYYAAVDKGYYREECLDVTILTGAVDIVPQQVVASGQAEFGIAWVPKALVSREEGAKLVNIGQVFQRSGTLEVSWKDSGITRPEDWAGKTVGTWGFGNEFELLAAMRQASLDPDVDVSDIPKAVRLDEWLRRYQAADIAFAQLPFDHPAYILFTSGTTGKPKCIVHGAGGSLLQGLKMYKLQFDLRAGDRFFYYCTTNWVVWNLLFGALMAEATVMLYDGSPFAKDGRILFEYAQRERITHFGTSAKFIDAIAKRGVRPREHYDLPGLRMLISTGSPLSAESYDYVYEAVKKDVCLSSISGGTDIMAAFADANAVLPVYRGEMQCRSLGLAVEVYDEDGNSIVGKKGELVCTRPFPSMPLGFWNDRGDERYHAAYFDKYPNVWCHGDWSELTERGTMIVYGRSDATLNPGGVRIGTAEIYRVVERIAEVEEAVAIGQLWPPDKPTDTRVVLFLKLKETNVLDEELAERIRAEIKDHASPRHVPAKIVQVSDIPRTKNGKVVELAVRSAVHGMPIGNTDALANPEALELFRDLPELAT